MNGWIGVDLDGTLAVYTEWKGNDYIGEPIQLMLDRVKKWIAKGIEVRVFTARAGEEEAIQPIKDWCIEYVGQELLVTNVKDFEMLELWDDRCVQVKTNTGEIVG